MTTQEALIVVDQQNGFIPTIEGGTGELGVEGGGLLSEKINTLMRQTKTAGGLIIATRDWHPEGHMSFASNYEGKNPFNIIGWDDVVNGKDHPLQLNPKAGFTLKDLETEFGAVGNQVLWPDHCITGTPSAEYHHELDTALIDHHIIKGYDATQEMYSGFQGKERESGKTLLEILEDAGIISLKIVGIATDYCIKATAIHSVRNGFLTTIMKDMIAGVDIKSPEETITYLEALRKKENIHYE